MTNALAAPPFHEAMMTAELSPRMTVCATIAGGKAHLVTARELLAPMTFTDKPHSWSAPRTVELDAGELIYIAPVCGTTRGHGILTYENSYRPAAFVDCARCMAKGSR